ncbi:MAG: diguanylate cyclase, partial [Bradyrhizobium sp.]|nr:diguanylate cyclase [Bradyrhizobium sp.]
MRPVRPIKPKKLNRVPRARDAIRPVKPTPKLAQHNLGTTAVIDEVAGRRAEAEAAIAEAEKAHDRLIEAIDILPEGIVFLDSEGRY